MAQPFRPTFTAPTTPTESVSPKGIRTLFPVQSNAIALTPRHRIELNPLAISESYQVPVEVAEEIVEMLHFLSVKDVGPRSAELFGVDAQKYFGILADKLAEISSKDAVPRVQGLIQQFLEEIHNIGSAWKDGTSILARQKAAAYAVRIQGLRPELLFIRDQCATLRTLLLECSVHLQSRKILAQILTGLPELPTESTPTLLLRQDSLAVSCVSAKQGVLTCDAILSNLSRFISIVDRSIRETFPAFCIQLSATSSNRKTLATSFIKEIQCSLN